MADFESKYTGEEVEQFLDQIANGEAGGGGAVDNVYYTDFSIGELDTLIHGDIEELIIDSENLEIAIREKKRILVPCVDDGFAILCGESYGSSELYFSVVSPYGHIYHCECYNGVLYPNSIYFNNLIDTFVKGGKNQYDSFLAFADGFSSSHGDILLPGTSGSSSDDVIATKKTLKTINGESIVGSGDITIKGGEGNLDSEVVSSTEASEEFPQVLYVEQTLTEEQKAQARKNIGVGGMSGGSYDDTELRTELESQGELIEDLQNMKIDRENDDYYPKMAVGLADNLAGVDVVDSEINFRRSGGGAITDGVARIESIKGNSVVWNQMAQQKIVVTYNKGGWSCTTQEYKIEQQGYNYVIEGTGNIAPRLVHLIKFDASHKYVACFGIMAEGDISGNSYIGYTSAPTKWFDNINVDDVRGKRKDFTKFLSIDSSTVQIHIGLYNISVPHKLTVYNPIVVDLTKMFGTGNEPTTIEELYTRIPIGVDLNAYNEGEVIHMDVQSIESQGVNAWDEEWEEGIYSVSDGIKVDNSTAIRTKHPIPILPNTKYYKSCGSTHSFFWHVYYDKDMKYIGYQGASYNHEFVTPDNAAYMTSYTEEGYGSTYNHDICINLSDTSINGKYFPYIKRVEDLSIIRKYFPEGMKSAGSAHDEIRYNKESGKWERIYKIGESDMGDFSWSYQPKNSSYPHGFFYTSLDIDLRDMKNGAEVMSAIYAKGGFADDKTIASNASNKMLYARDSTYTDAASFKAAMRGIMLYYELAEPIVTELDEADQFKDLDYQVWNAGTEKAIAEGKSAPLAADITYGFNAIGKIKELESLVAALRAKVGI